MKSININYRKNTIEITAAFAKKASRYVSKEYEDMVNIRSNFPTFTISVVNTTSKRKGTFKGLSYECMKKYIINESGADSEQMKNFDTLCGNSNEQSADKASYGQIKKWFLSEYPDFKNADEKIKRIIEAANRKNA